VYLSDLQEFGLKPGPLGWRFGKNGGVGADNPNEKIVVGGKTSAKGLGLHPAGTGFVRACYALGGRAATLQGAVCISEKCGGKPGPVRFVVLGDGKVLWRSGSIDRSPLKQPFYLDVSEVQILELRVYAEVNNNITYSWAAWVDPRLEVK
jgi:hypothetical protein